MDRDVTREQRALLDSSVRFIEQACPLSALRAGAHRDRQHALDYSRRAADLGWFSMLVPERLGGGNISGNGLLDAALIAYQRGRLLQPGNFVATNTVAYALAETASADQTKVLTVLMSGEESAAWVVPEVYGPGGGSLIATGTSRGYELNGSASFVVEAEAASWLLVTESAPGRRQFLLPATSPGLTITALESLDLCRQYANVEFTNVLAAPADVVDAARAETLVDEQLAIAATLTAAETVGAMDRDLELAVQYAKDRVTFGRPIGSYQAIKHLLADTSMYLEMSKALVSAAAASLGAREEYGVNAASIAKAFVSEHGQELAQHCFQVFGGIGFTWEHDQHLYLRRIAADGAAFGDPSWHREHLCQLSGLQ